MAKYLHRALPLSVLCFILLCCGCGSGSPDLSPQPATGNPASGQTVLATADTVLHDVLMQPQQEISDFAKRTSLAAPQGLLDSLPPLSEAERAASCLGTGWFLEGSQYADELPLQGITRVGEEETDGEFVSSGNPEHIDNAGYAIYRWNLRNFSGLQTIGFNWAEGGEPLDWSNFYVGLGNLQLDRWQFYQGPSDGVLTIDSFGPYRAADGDVLLVLILLGEQQATLDFMEAGVPEQRATGAVNLPEGAPDYPLLAADTGLPESFDLGELCAPINDQGRWGSCTAFAVGDGAFNYELSQTYGSYGWDLSQSRFRVSPKHLYIVSGELQGFPPGGGTGRWTSEVVADLVSNGVATELHAPYDLVYDNNWSSEALADAQVLKIEDWSEVPCNTWEGIETVKQVLAHQLKVLPMQAYLDSSFFDVGPADTWYYSGFFAGGHAMCIVGYDDSRGVSGAFKVRNSWSSYWGDNGYVWIGYEAFLDPRSAIRCWTITEEYAGFVADHFGLDGSAGVPVTGLSASKGTNQGGIQLNWQQQSGAGSYTILRDDRSNVVATVFAPESSWLDEGITDGFGHVYWVQASGGPLSAPDVGYRAAIPEIAAILPKTGEEGSELTISAAITGSAPLTYSWDFGGAANPSTSSDPRPLVTLNGPGSYSCKLVLQNPLGSDTFNFVLEVTPQPTIISHIGGASGFSASPATLSAVLSGTPTSYSWDFGGGASPDSSSAAQPLVTLGSPGQYPASLEVSNGSMTDIYNFTLTVLEGSAAPWSQPGYDGRNTHQSPVVGPGNANIRWKFNAQYPWVDSGTRRVSEVLELPGGNIVFSCHKFEQGGSIYCTGKDGSLVWTHDYAGPTSLGRPLLSPDGSLVYAQVGEGIRCWNSADGTEQWYAVPEEINQGYEIAGDGGNGELYVILAGKWLRSLDSNDGSVVLDSLLLSDRFSEVRFGQLTPDGSLFLPGRMGYDRMLLKFDTGTNTPQETIRMPNKVTGFAVAADGITLIVTDSAGDVRALDVNTCRELWLQKDLNGGGQTPCVMADGTVIVTNIHGIVSALSPLDGSVLWDYDLALDGDARSWPAIGRDGTVYLGGDMQRVYAVKDGALVWQSELSSTRYFNGSASILSDGTLCIGDEAGWLWAFGAGNGELISRPVIDQVSPANGDSGVLTQFTAHLDHGSAPLSYSWDFGGGASPDNSTDAMPEVTLGAIGSYICSVQVSNPWGVDSLQFQLDVTDPNAMPEWQSHEIDLLGQNNDAFASAAIVNGKPGLFLIRENSPNPLLYYYESSEAEPTLDIDWTRTTLSSNGWIDQAVSMGVFNGEPAAAYVFNDQTLRYTSRSSGVWSSHDIKGGNFIGKSMSLASVNGKPAVAYADYDGSKWPLGYAFASVANPSSSGDWGKMAYTDVNIDGARVVLGDNGGLPQVAFVTRDAGDVFHVTFASSNSASPAGNANWASHFLYSGINYRDRIAFSQAGGKPQVCFTLHDTVDDALFYGQSTSAVPASSADWDVHQLHSGGQIDIRRLFLSSSKPAICWNDNTANPVGYAYAKMAQPQQASDWDIEAHPLGIQVLAVLEVAGNPVLIAMLQPDNELRYYVYK